MSWPTLIMVVGTLIGGWALIGVLIDVSQSFDTVLGANWLWVIIALSWPSWLLSPRLSRELAVSPAPFRSGK